MRKKKKKEAREEEKVVQMLSGGYFMALHNRRNQTFHDWDLSGGLGNFGFIFFSGDMTREGYSVL